MLIDGVIGKASGQQQAIRFSKNPFSFSFISTTNLLNSPLYLLLEVLKRQSDCYPVLLWLKFLGQSFFPRYGRGSRSKGDVAWSLDAEHGYPVLLIHQVAWSEFCWKERRVRQSLRLTYSGDLFINLSLLLNVSF